MQAIIALRHSAVLHGSGLVQRTFQPVAARRSAMRALCRLLFAAVGLRSAHPACALLLIAFGISGAHAAPFEPVSIPTANISSSPEPLIAFLFKPAGAGPHPAVVMLHGCGGAYDGKGVLGSRHRMWGEYFASQGYEALMLDSFSSRDIKEICTVKFGDRTIKESERVGDAYAALAWLRQQNNVDAKRIAVLGWSHGAGVTLDTITHRPDPAQVGSGFKAAVSFYPGCTARENHPDRFHPYSPLLVLIGESDDWTPAAPCKALTAAVAGARRADEHRHLPRHLSRLRQPRHQEQACAQGSAKRCQSRPGSDYCAQPRST